MRKKNAKYHMEALTFNCAFIIHQSFFVCAISVFKKRHFLHSRRQRGSIYQRHLYRLTGLKTNLYVKSFRTTDSLSPKIIIILMTSQCIKTKIHNFCVLQNDCGLPLFYGHYSNIQI